MRLLSVDPAFIGLAGFSRIFVKMSDKQSLLSRDESHSQSYGASSSVQLSDPPASLVNNKHDSPSQSNKLTFHNLSYEVSSCFGKERKVILYSVK